MSRINFDFSNVNENKKRKENPKPHIDKIHMKMGDGVSSFLNQEDVYKWRQTNKSLKGDLDYRYLDFSNFPTSKITDTFLEDVFSSCDKLKILALNLAWCDQITDDGLQHISKLQNLQSLKLNGCYKITDTGLEHISNLEKLQTLNLYRCDNVTDKGLQHISKLQNLQSLKLIWCDKITDTGLKHISNLKNLEVSMGSHELDYM